MPLWPWPLTYALDVKTGPGVTRNVRNVRVNFWLSEDFCSRVRSRHSTHGRTSNMRINGQTDAMCNPACWREGRTRTWQITMLLFLKYKRRYAKQLYYSAHKCRLVWFKLPHSPTLPPPVTAKYRVVKFQMYFSITSAERLFSPTKQKEQ